MSRTTNSQNALVNLLRPTITYDSGVGFIPKLVLSNIDVLTANQIVTDNFQFGGVGGNVFIGSNVGGGTGNSNNVGIGVTALAGATLTTGTVAIGYNALQSASNVSNSVGIGTGVVGGGVSNVIVGANAGTTGPCNVILGAGMNAGNSSNKLYIGTGGISNTTIGGDLQLRRVGIATSDPQTTLDVSGTTYIREYLGVGVYPPQAHIHTNGLIYATSGFRAQGGSATEPAFSFIDDSGTGFYQISNGFAITNKGVEQVLIQDASFGIRGDLWVSGSVNISGTGAVNQTIQGYIRLPSSTNPTIDISGDSIRVDGYVKAGGSLRTDGSIRVGPFASPTVDISGSTVSAATLRGTTATITPIVRDATVPSGFDLSGGSLRLASNVELNTGFVRSTAGGFRVGPLLAPTTDISSGNIRLTGHLDISTGTAGRPSLGFVTDGSSGIHSGGTSILAFDTSGIQRMTLSNGNLGIGKATPVVALEVVGDVSATTYNGPGGTAGAPHYTFSDDRTTGLFFPNAGTIGFTTAGSNRMCVSGGFVGIGTTLPTAALEISGGALRITSATGGPIVLSNGTISIAGSTVVSSTGVFSNGSATSNSIGGVTLNNFDISMSTTGRILGIANTSNQIGGATLSNGTVATSNLRSALSGWTYDISTDISLSSGRFLGPTTTSNRIGGATLSNGTVAATNFRNSLSSWTVDISTDISLSSTGRFLGPATTSNQIGGVTLSNGSLGVGTVSPAANLEVSGSDPVLRISTPNTNVIGNVPRIEFTRGTGAFGAGAETGWYMTSFSNNIYLTNRTNGVSTDSVRFSPGTSAQIVGLVNGSAASPFYSFGTDPTTGVFMPASSQLGFTTGGTQRMVISNANVGIGRAAPVVALDVNGDISATNISNSGTTRSSNFVTITASSNRIGGVTLSNTDICLGGTITFTSTDTTKIHLLPATSVGTTGPRIAHAGGWNTQFFAGASTQPDPTGIFTFNTSISGSTVERMRIMSNGNIGIDATAPAARIHLNGTVSSNAILLTNSSANGATRAVSSGLVSNEICGLSSTWTDAGQLRLSAGGGGNASQKTFIDMYGFNTNTLTLGTQGTARMTIDGTGRTGVGTTNPAALLDVSSGTSAPGIMVQNGGLFLRNRPMWGQLFLYNATSQNAIVIEDISTGLRAVDNYPGISGAPLGWQMMTDTNVGSNKLVWQRINGPGGTIPYVMTLTPPGNLGIGTTDPAYTLDVCGAITNASINMSTWPRMGGSTMYVGSYSSRTGDMIVWTNTTAINSNLMTYADFSGTYFIVKKSGIWNIQFRTTGTSVGNWVYGISFRNTSNYSNSPASSNVFLSTTLTNAEGGSFASFNGYLPSNDSIFYKTWVTQGNNPSAGTVVISFLSESSQTVSGFPI